VLAFSLLCFLAVAAASGQYFLLFPLLLQEFLLILVTLSSTGSLPATILVAVGPCFAGFPADASDLTIPSPLAVACLPVVAGIKEI
jgi:hypothetical protein